MTICIHYFPKVVFISDHFVCRAFALNSVARQAVDDCGWLFDIVTL